MILLSSPVAMCTRSQQLWARILALQLCLSTPMHVAGLVLLAALAFADGSRVYTPPNSASARRKDRLGEIEKSLSSMALLQAQQEDQLAKTTEQLAQTRKLFQMLMEDEEAEATEKPIAETSVPPTTTTTTVTTATTRGQPPAISLKDAARYGDVAAFKQHFQARLLSQ
eukprot:s363_g1.t1